jgi:hypothetical protein
MYVCMYGLCELDCLIYTHIERDPNTYARVSRLLTYTYTHIHTLPIQVGLNLVFGYDVPAIFSTYST